MIISSNTTSLTPISIFSPSRTTVAVGADNNGYDDRDGYHDTEDHGEDLKELAELAKTCKLGNEEATGQDNSGRGIQRIEEEGAVKEIINIVRNGYDQGSQDQLGGIHLLIKHAHKEGHKSHAEDKLQGDHLEGGCLAAKAVVQDRTKGKKRQCRKDPEQHGQSITHEGKLARTGLLYRPHGIYRHHVHKDHNHHAVNGDILLAHFCCMRFLIYILRVFLTHGENLLHLSPPSDDGSILSEAIQGKMDST